MSEMITIKADKNVQAYLARPDGEPRGAVIVVHEVWGLVDHIKDVANRFANEGYLALAPNLLFEVDFSNVDIKKLQHQLFDPKSRSEAQPILRKLMAPMQDPNFGAKTVERLKACFDYLYSLPDSHQKVAICGFCFGGSYSFALAINEPRLMMALPFYGHADQDVNELKQIKCPVHAFYGEKDENLMAGLDNLRQRMNEAQVNYTDKVYPKCGHAFFNDTNPLTYNLAAAEDSWDQLKNDLSSVMQ